MAIIYRGVRYAGIWAHKAWKGQRIPQTLWSVVSGCSLHFPGADEGYDYEPMGYVGKGDEVYRKWKAFKVSEGRG
jgi:hypothetical protein